jgi:hypothetical protein
MGLLKPLLGWPLLPVQGVVRLAQLIQQQAERELYGPASVRRELEQIQRALECGEISEAEAAQAEQEAATRFTQRLGSRKAYADTGED